jgi:hypothetical protein
MQVLDITVLTIDDAKLMSKASQRAKKRAPEGALGIATEITGVTDRSR